MIADYGDMGDEWAYIDTSGNIQIDFYPYEASEGRMICAGDFQDGIAFVSKALYCIIDEDGKDVFDGDSEFFICSLTYNKEYNVIPGYAFVDKAMTVKKYGLMGLHGEQRIAPQFDYIDQMRGQYVIVSMGEGDACRKGIIQLKLINNYEGKWKVTQKVSEYSGAVSYFCPHHYLGRTLVLDEKSVEKSIWYWPFELEWKKEEFEEVEVASFNGEDPWVKSNIRIAEIENYIDAEEMQLIRYFKGEGETKYCALSLVVTKEGDLLYEWIGGYYLLEPFQYCESDVRFADLGGEWEISYLDSYDTTYQGSYEDIEMVKEAYNNARSELNQLIGSDFRAEEWLGKRVQITPEYVVIQDLVYEISDIEEKTVRKKEFEQQYQIHDELSLYDEEIKVCMLKCNNAETLLVVLVSEEKVIVHIEQGWFMLSKL